MEEKVPKKTNGKRNKAAGHGWELDIIKILIARGLYGDEVVTCRSNNRRLDAQGIDLMHLNETTHGMMKDSIQGKTAVRMPPYPKLLDRIRKAGRPGPVIFHRQTAVSTSEKSKGLKQVEQDRFAITYLDRYLELMACEKFVNEVKILIRLAQGDPPGNCGDFIRTSKIEDKLTKLGL